MTTLLTFQSLYLSSYTSYHVSNLGFMIFLSLCISDDSPAQHSQSCLYSVLSVLECLVLNKGIKICTWNYFAHCQAVTSLHLLQKALS